MQIKQIYTHGPYRNFSYLIISKNKEQVFCVDPFDGGQIEQILENDGIKLTAIINTHEHGDHTCGNQYLIDRYGVEVWAHEKAKDKITSIGNYLKHNQIIELGNKESLKIWVTPGHTMAHICLLAQNNAVPFAILTGDTLFNAGVGNCKNGGNSEVLFQTINELFSDLADEVLVYPGHDYFENNLKFTLDREKDNHWAKDILHEYQEKIKHGQFLVSTMGLERKINAFLRLESATINNELGLKNSARKETFIELRKYRDQW